MPDYTIAVPALATGQIIDPWGGSHPYDCGCEWCCIDKYDTLTLEFTAVADAFNEAAGADGLSLSLSTNSDSWSGANNRAGDPFEFVEANLCDQPCTLAFTIFDDTPVTWTSSNGVTYTLWARLCCNGDGSLALGLVLESDYTSGAGCSPVISTRTYALIPFTPENCPSFVYVFEAAEVSAAFAPTISCFGFTNFQLGIVLTVP